MKINLATDLKTRVGDTTKDARLKNAYVEVRGDQSVVRHRPSARGGVAVGSGVAQGGYGNVLFWGDTAYTVSDSTGTTWDAGTSYSVGDHVSYNFVDYWALTNNSGSQPPSGDWDDDFVPPVPPVYATTDAYLTFNDTNVINWTDVHGGYLNESGNPRAVLSSSHSAGSFAGMVALVIADAESGANVNGTYTGSVWDSGISGFVAVTGTYTSSLTMISATAVDENPQFYINSVLADITSASCSRSDLIPNGTVIGSLGGKSLYAWWYGNFSAHP